MSRTPFQKRFQGRISLMNKQGAIELDSKFLIHKSKLNSPLIASATTMLGKPLRVHHRVVPNIDCEENSRRRSHCLGGRLRNHSQKYSLHSNSLRLKTKHRLIPIDMTPTTTEPETTFSHMHKNFVPCTLKEYKNLAVSGYHKLGGLGPSYMWTKYEERKRKRREDYAKTILRTWS